MEETYFGVHEDLLYARKINPVQGSPVCLRSFILAVLNLKTSESENVGVLITYPPYLNIVKLVEILNDRGTVDGNSDNYCCGNAESRVGRGSHLCSKVKQCLANLFLVFYSQTYCLKCSS